MNKRPLIAAATLLLASTACGCQFQARASGSSNNASQSLSNLKGEKLSSIYRREPRAEGLIPRVETKIEQLKADPTTAAYGQRLEKELTRIEMGGASESEARLKEDVNLLEAATKAGKPATAAELAPLQEKYAKLIADIDDTMFVKDYDRLLKKHDRLVRYAALGLWDKDKLAEELQNLQDMQSSAPDIAYGKAEALRGLQNRKLAPVKNLVYMGTYPHEEVLLSPDRRSLAVLEESFGTSNPIETADLTIQNPDGTMIDLTTPNNPAYGIPFAPPLALWLKSRMLEGRVPAVTFRLPSSTTIAQFAVNNPGTTSDTSKLVSVQDVIDGKLDDYFKKNVGIIAATKEAAVVGLFDNFDRELAENAFGKDGKTPFYMLDPKLSSLPADQARQDFVKRTEKGVYANPKTGIWSELSDQYGDPNIPDGPERVRDAWKHLKGVVGNLAPNIGYYTSAGAYHGSKATLKDPDLADAGTQAWNKLEYYWPGEGIFDWVGTEAVGPDPSEQPKGANIAEAVEQFFFETRSSAWQQTPVMLRGVAPGYAPKPESEAAWIPTLFQKMIKGTYPSVSIILVDAPDKLTLWSRDAATAYRSSVSSDKFYKWPLRFKMLTAAQK